MLSQVLADGAAVKAEFKANLREGFSLTPKRLSSLTILIGALQDRAAYGGCDAPHLCGHRPAWRFQ